MGNLTKQHWSAIQQDAMNDKTDLVSIDDEVNDIDKHKFREIAEENNKYKRRMI